MGGSEQFSPQALYDALDLEVNQGIKQYTPEHAQDLAEREYLDSQKASEAQQVSDIAPVAKSKTGVVSDISARESKPNQEAPNPFGFETPAKQPKKANNQQESVGNEALPYDDVPFSRSNVKDLETVKKSWDDKGINSFITESDGIITLHKIIIDKNNRGSGIGSKAMKELVAYADHSNQQIALSPTSDFGGSKARLNKFYKRFGFKKNNEYKSSEALLREPIGDASYSKSKADSPVVLTNVELDAVMQRVIDRTSVKLGVAGNTTRHKVVVVDAFSDLPSDITKQADKEGHSGDDVDGLFHKGNVYLIRDNLARHSDVEANTEKVLLHEFVHADMRAMFGKEIHHAMNSLWLSIGGNKGIRDIAKARGIDLSAYAKAGATANYEKFQRQSIMMDELLAHIGQVKPSLKDQVKKIVGMIRQWLRDKGLFKLAKYGETDLLNLISTARKQAAQTKDGDTRFMVAWHGSPHDHDKFSTDKIGTGEGAQAYGHGLYFAGNKDVAEWYKTQLSQNKAYQEGEINGEPAALYINRLGGVEGEAIKMLIENGNNQNLVFSSLKRKIKNSPIKGISKRAKEKLDFLEVFVKENDIKIKSGKLYQVELAPKQNEYLLWDKPLSEQSDKFRDVFDKVADELSLFETDRMIETVGKQALRGKTRGEHAAMIKDDYDNAGEVINGLGDMKGSDKAASEYMHSLGIRGIKYLDGSSRQVANYRISPPDEVKAGDWMVKGNDPTAKGVHFKTEAEAKAYIKEQESNAENYNYVIFNDEDVSITAKFSRSKQKTEDENIKGNMKAMQSAIRDYVGGSYKAAAKVGAALGNNTIFKPAQVIRDYGVEHARKIADKFLASDQHENRTTDAPDLMTQRYLETGKLLSRFQDIMEPLNNKFIMFDKDASGMFRGLPSIDNLRIVRALRTGKVVPRLKEESTALYNLLQDVRTYAINAGLDIGELAKDVNNKTGEYFADSRVSTYFPRVYDVEKISKNFDKFVAFLEREGKYSNEKAQRIGYKIINSEGSPELYSDIDGRVEVDKTGDVFTRRADGAEGHATKKAYEKGRKVLAGVEDADAILEPWLINDVEAVLTQHISNVVRRAEYARRFCLM